MGLLKAIAEVRAGFIERIAVPGVWKVWRDGDIARVEVRA